MLVLARKKNETIVINEEIVVQVLQIKGKTIRLGISAPNDVRIARGELKSLDEDSESGFSIVVEQEEDADPSQSSRSAADANGKSRSVRSSNGLNRFLKSNNQVGEDKPATGYNGPMPTSRIESSRVESQSGSRFKILSGDDQRPLNVQEPTTCYQATCEIELPLAQYRSNQN